MICKRIESVGFVETDINGKSQKSDRSYQKKKK